MKSNKLCNDLEKKLNVTPRKSFTTKLPENLNFENKLSLIVGLIDSDGTIRYNRKNIGLKICCGNKEMGEYIGNCFSCILGERKISLYKHGSIWSLCYEGNKLVPKILKPLYDLPLPKLERKWSLLDKFYTKGNDN